MRHVFPFSRAMLLALPLLFALAACPGPTGGLVLQVSPVFIEFGSTLDEQTFTVALSGASPSAAPIVVVPGAAWLDIQNCTSSADNCVNTGPGSPITITVHMDRSQLTAGVTNSARIEVRSEGLVSQFVQATADSPVVVDFTVDNRTPFEDMDVQFTATVQSSAGWSVPDSGWAWDFGNGETSTKRHPDPVRYSVTGAGPQFFAPRLSVTATDGTQNLNLVVEKTDYVLVFGLVPPTAGFEVPESQRLVAVDSTVSFLDTSEAGSASIDTWSWDFGDGGTSQEQNPQHRYTSGGAFTVVLTVTSAHGSDSLTRNGFITAEARPPTVDFSADDLDPRIDALVQFTDRSDPGSRPIVEWLWTFTQVTIDEATGEPVLDPGTNLPVETPVGTDNVQNPVRLFDVPGEFSVELSVTNAHGDADTLKKDRFIVSREVSPAADFLVEPLAGPEGGHNRGLVGITEFQFSDASDPGTSEILSWAWDFGDGQPVSTEQNPTHTYQATPAALAGAGAEDPPTGFTVSLTVTTSASTAPSVDTHTLTNFVKVFEPTALDNYIMKPDDAFDKGIPDVFPALGYTTYVLELTSQRWRSAGDFGANPEDSDQPEWKHWLTIVRPDTVRHTTALLVLQAGERSVTAPTEIVYGLAQLAVDTGSVIAVLGQVPNQPLVFAGETLSSSNDTLIAYSLGKYLDSAEADLALADDEWPILFPMVKSAVRGMDAIQTFLSIDVDVAARTEVDDFVVIGADSDAGWATWLIGAADRRVRAIMPMSFDFLKIEAQVAHQRSVYGFLPESLLDYDQQGVLDRLGTEAGQALLQIVDPFSYNDRFDDVPKLLVKPTGSLFSAPDSASLYFGDLKGEKKLVYLPNTRDSVDGFNAMTESFVPWYEAILADEALPQFEWEIVQGEASDQLIATPATPPDRAQVIMSTSRNRDFRFDSYLNQLSIHAWEAEDISDNGQGQFVSEFRTVIPSLWTAFFVQFTFNRTDENGAPALPFVFSSEIRVGPAGLSPVSGTTPPLADFFPPSDPAAGDVLTFFDLSAPGSGPVVRWEWDFDDGTVLLEQYPFTTFSRPTHTYSAAGDYLVALKVTTAHGSSETMQTISVAASAAKGDTGTGDIGLR